MDAFTCTFEFNPHLFLLRVIVLIKYYFSYFYFTFKFTQIHHDLNTYRYENINTNYKVRDISYHEVWRIIITYLHYNLIMYLNTFLFTKIITDLIAIWNTSTGIEITLKVVKYFMYRYQDPSSNINSKIDISIEIVSNISTNIVWK